LRLTIALELAFEHLFNQGNVMINKKPLLTILYSSYLLLANNQLVLANDIQYNLRVDGITCPFCIATSAKALRKIDGVTHVDADLKNNIIKVCAGKNTNLNDEALTQLFLDKGFSYRGKETQTKCDT